MRYEMRKIGGGTVKNGVEYPDQYGLPVPFAIYQRYSGTSFFIIPSGNEAITLVSGTSFTPREKEVEQ